MITKAVFEKEFKNDIKRVKRRSRVYLRLHSAENVHDLRTALKRIDSRAEILPKHTMRDLSKYLKERKLQRRQGRISNRLNNKIELLLPIVIEDPKRYEELHSLRKTCKELRYILEASGEEGKTDSLRKWQRYLGEIHDSDVVIAYLSKQKKTQAITNVIRDLSLARAKQFRDFVNLFEKKPQDWLQASSVVPAEKQNLVPGC